MVQSFANTERVFREETAENCTPGFPTPVCTTETRTVPVLDAAGQPQTRTSWVGLANYAALLQPEAVGRRFAPATCGALGNDRLLQGAALHADVHADHPAAGDRPRPGARPGARTRRVRMLRGPVIFASLLPFIITPVIGALSIRWLFDSDGILTAALRADPRAPRLDAVA